MFWVNSKGRVLYTSGRKHPQPPRYWKGKSGRGLHKKKLGATYGAINLVLLHRDGEEVGRVVFKTWVYRTISKFLDANVGGGTARLGTSEPIKE